MGETAQPAFEREWSHFKFSNRRGPYKESFTKMNVDLSSGWIEGGRDQRWGGLEGGSKSLNWDY